MRKLLFALIEEGRKGGVEFQAGGFAAALSGAVLEIEEPRVALGQSPRQHDVRRDQELTRR